MSNNKKEAVCNFCNEGFLHWEKVYGGWKLLTPEGSVHKCQAYDKSKKDQKSDSYQNNYNNGNYKKRY
jgi:hypothetical protein